MEPHRAQEEAADVGEEAAGGIMPPVFKGGIRNRREMEKRPFRSQSHSSCCTSVKLWEAVVSLSEFKNSRRCWYSGKSL